MTAFAKVIVDLALLCLAVSSCLVLWVFALRRILFTLTLLAPRPSISNFHQPSVLLLVAVRDEAPTLPGLFAALDALNYPRELLRVVLVNDGSTDDSSALMSSAAASRPNWQVLNLPANAGKAQALNMALAQHPFGEVVYVFDADHRPRPDCLRRAAAAFADPRVAGVSGRTLAENALASGPAYYAAVESIVHQVITMRGKDVLGLAPALLGSNNGYRRSALAEVGGFRSGAFLEDTELTLALYRVGRTVRFVADAASTHRVPVSIAGYVRQHARWGRGFADAARRHLVSLLAGGRLSLPLRIELAIFSLGYLDRLALVTAAALAACGVARPLALWSIAFSLALPFVQMIAALAFDRAPLAMWLRLPWAPAMFLFDSLAAVWAAVSTVLNLPRVWYKTERA